MTIQAQFNTQLPDFKNWLYHRFLEIAIYPSIWVSASIASLIVFTQHALSLDPDWRPIALVFSVALIPYNLDHFVDSFVQKNPDPEYNLYFRNPILLLLLLIASVATGILLYQAPLMVRLVSCEWLIALLYGIPLFPLRRNRKIRWYRIKDIPGAKAWIVSGTIAYSVVAVPLAYANAPFDKAAVLTTLFIWVFSSSNCHVFDIRDIDSDREKGVLTMPVMVGIRGTRIILTLLNLLMLCLCGLAWIDGNFILNPFVVVPSSFVSLFYIWLVDSNSPRSIYNIWIEGCTFLPALLTRLT